MVATFSNSKRWAGSGRGIVALFEFAAIVLGLVSVVGAIFSGADYALALLPLGYLLFLLCLGQDNVVRWAPGIVVLNVVLFLRFVFVPFVMCITGEVSIYILDKTNLSYGVPLMLYELIGIGIVLKATSKKQRQTAKNQKTIIAGNLYYSGFIALIAVALLVLLASRYRYLISGFSLITEGTVDGYTKDDLASGLVIALWDSLLAWVFIWLLLVVKKSIKNEKKALVCSVVLAFGFLILVYTGQITVSRWHTVIAFAAALFCLICLFPRHKKGLIISMVVPVAALIVTASAFKNSSYYWSGIEYSQALRELFDVSVFDIYLAGPSTVSDGVTMYLFGVSDIGSLIVDAVQDLPFVNHWVDESISTVYQYHAYWGRGDLIMPLIGQSMIYFGWPFAPAMSMVAVYFLRIFDRLAFTAPSLPHAFIAGFAGAWLGVATVLNLTITMSWFGLRIAPFYLLIQLTEIFGRSNREVTGCKANTETWELTASIRSQNLTCERRRNHLSTIGEDL